MNAQDFVKLGLQVACMLGVAVFLGELMRRFKQPAVVGEMFGGILLGPTVLGMLAPAAYAWLFQSSADVALVRDASIKLGMLFFLFYAGSEVDLSDLRALGKRALCIGLVGTLLPIAAGVGLVYAPIYFTSMGLTTNFVQHFDLALVALVFSAACVSKVGAVLLGARAAGMRLDREAWAVGFGLNARGATGIILAGVGLSNRVIDERIFVAVVLMAILTSMMSGPLMNQLLGQGRDLRQRHP